MATRTPTKTHRATVPVKRAAAAKAAPTDLAKPLSGEDVMKIMQLGKGSNSIELKLSVPMGGHRATARSIGLDPVEAQPRQAFYFDTPDLALNRAGVVLRGASRVGAPTPWSSCGRWSRTRSTPICAVRRR